MLYLSLRLWTLQIRRHKNIFLLQVQTNLIIICARASLKKRFSVRTIVTMTSKQTRTHFWRNNITGTRNKTKEINKEHDYIVRIQWEILNNHYFTITFVRCLLTSWHRWHTDTSAVGLLLFCRALTYGWLSIVIEEWKSQSCNSREMKMEWKMNESYEHRSCISKNCSTTRSEKLSQFSKTYSVLYIMLSEFKWLFIVTPYCFK